MPPVWKPQSHEVIKHWFDTIMDEAEEKLNDWERNFLDSIEKKINFQYALTEAQEKVLERIYAEKTS